MEFLKNYKNSFYNIHEYKKFAKYPTKKIMKHMIIISLVISLIGIVFFGQVAYRLADIGSTMFKNTPNFEMKNGILSVGDNVPIEMSSGGTIIYIDTSKDLMFLEDYIKTNPENNKFYLVLKDALVMKQNGEMRIIKFDQSAFKDFTKEEVSSMLDFGKKMIVLVLIAFWIVFFLYVILVYIISSFIRSLIGLLCNFFIKSKIKFNELWKISLFIEGAVITIQFLLRVVPFRLPVAPIMFVISIVYFIVILNRIKDDEVKEVI